MAVLALKKRFSLPAVTCIAAIYALRVVRYLLYHQGGVLNLILNLAVDYLSVSLMYKDKASNKTFVLFTFYAIMFLCDALTVSAFGAIAFFIYTPLFDRAALPIVMYLISRLFLIPFLLLYRENSERIQQLLKRPLLALPIPFIFCFLQTAISPIGDGANLYYSHPALYYGTYTLLFVAAAVFFFAFLQYKTDALQAKRQLQELTHTIHLQEQYYGWLKNKLLEHDQKLHDLKNHLSYVDFEGKYLQELGERYSDELEYTGHKRIDSILFYEITTAEKLGIDLKIEGALRPESAWLHAVDAFVIVDNAVQNAVAAVLAAEEEHRAPITIRFVDKGNRIAMQVMNQISAAYEKSDIPIQSKRGKGHGHGMQNILKTAQQYEGHMEYGSSGVCFTLSILLQK